jgi:hypothetical protein
MKGSQETVIDPESPEGIDFNERYRPNIAPAAEPGKQ